MATNVYEYEEKIYFNPDKPGTYYGWYVSFSGDQIQVAHFEKPKTRTLMLNAVSRVLKKHKVLGVRLPLVAALTLEKALGGCDFAGDELERAIDEADAGTLEKSGHGDWTGHPVWDALNEVGDKFTAR